MSDNAQFIAWVKLKKYVELTGDSAAAVHARRRSGKWLDGVHCRVVDEALWVHVPTAQKWVETWRQRASERPSAQA